MIFIIITCFYKISNRILFAYRSGGLNPNYELKLFASAIHNLNLINCLSIKYLFLKSFDIEYLM
ncbi:MAG TPA: hypothetical protein DEF85_04920 [Clostridiaceae bacterium]|jgi:hypothetical protein|nr:hypothetical protein [Clostridiaceae bacterium]HBX48216.1 hypothetical protein [Clostridiaceae bacterium]